MLNCTCATKHVSTSSINGIPLYVHVAVKEPIRFSRETSLVLEDSTLLPVLLPFHFDFTTPSKIFPPAFSRFEGNSSLLVLNSPRGQSAFHAHANMRPTGRGTKQGHLNKMQAATSCNNRFLSEPGVNALQTQLNPCISGVYVKSDEAGFVKSFINEL